MFTVKELDKRLHGEDDFEDDDSGYVNFLDAIQYEDSVDLGEPFGVATRVDFQGGDGDGAWQRLVFKVGDRLFATEGNHSSWDSDYWENEVYEVEAYQKSVTDYRKI
jgi:hypothetical protein